MSNEILAPYGKEMTWEIKAGLMGRPAHESARHLIAATQVPLTPDELLAEMDRRLPNAFTQVQPLPGVLKLVEHLVKSVTSVHWPCDTADVRFKGTRCR